MLGAGQRGIELNRNHRHPLCRFSNFAASFLHRIRTRRQHRLLGSAVSLSLRLHPHWLTTWKQNCSSHKEILLLSNLPFFFSFFAFDLLHPLHITGPRCTGRILRGSPRRTPIQTGHLSSRAGNSHWVWAGNYHQMCSYGWERDTGLVCPGLRLDGDTSS